MSKQKLIIYSAMLAIGGSGLAIAPGAYAFDMGNMMNPGKWMGGKNKDRYYDDDYYYDRGRYGYGGPYGGYGGPYGYGAPYGGYGGYGGYPGYGYGAPGYYPQQQQSNEPPPPPLPQ